MMKRSDVLYTRKTHQARKRNQKILLDVILTQWISTLLYQCSRKRLHPEVRVNDGSDPEQNEAVEMDDLNPTVQARTQTRQPEARALNLALEGIEAKLPGPTRTTREARDRGGNGGPRPAATEVRALGGE